MRPLEVGRPEGKGPLETGGKKATPTDSASLCPRPLASESSESEELLSLSEEVELWAEPLYTSALYTEG